MSEFENATPRPWRAEGPDFFGDYNIEGPPPDFAIGAVVSNMRKEAEVAANAELIIRAVNAHEALVEALVAGTDQLSKRARREEDQVVLRKMVKALKLARGKS